MRAVKDGLKRALPKPLLHGVMGGFHYYQRLRHWRLVMGELRGATSTEQAKLRRSFRAAPRTAWGRFDRWENPLLLEETTVEAPGIGVFHCRPRMDDLFHVLPSAQPGVRRALESHLSAGMTFVDAGANIGFFTVLGARLVGPTGTVVAVEMMPDTAGLLRRHVADNGLETVTVVEQALADSVGQEIVARTPRNHVGQASIVVSDFADDDVIEHRVRTTTLDVVTRDLPSIDFLKVDVEGAEAVAFAGARETFAKTRAMVFESRPGDPSSEAAAAAVRAAGFSLRPLDGYNTLATRG